MCIFLFAKLLIKTTLHQIKTLTQMSNDNNIIEMLKVLEHLVRDVSQLYSARTLKERIEPSILSEYLSACKSHSGHVKALQNRIYITSPCYYCMENFQNVVLKIEAKCLKIYTFVTTTTVKRIAVILRDTKLTTSNNKNIEVREKSVFWY